MRRLMVAAAALAVLVAFPSSASAGGPPVSISVDGVHMLSKELVAVDLTVSCTVMAPTAHRHVEFDWPVMGVDILQAVGNREAYGWAGVSFDGFELCDGTSHAVTLTAAADPSGRPFKAGRIVVDAYIDASFYWWNNRTDRDGYVVQVGNSGWVPMRLTH